MSEYKTAFFIPVVILHFITAISACFLNILVIVSIFKTPALHSPSRILLCSLSLLDLLVGAIAQPVAAFYYISAFNNWIDAFCVLWVIMTRGGYTIGLTSFIILAALTVDRCLAVTTKNNYKLIVTKRRTVIFSIVLLIFVGSATITGVELLSSNERYTVLAIVGGIVLFTIIFSFAVAFQSLKKITTSSVSPGQPNQGRNTSDFNVVKYRYSLTTMIMILALNLIVYLPVVGLSVGIAVGPVPYRIVYSQYFGFLITLNSTLNPLFYIWRMKDLRRAVKTKLYLLKGCYNLCS